MSSIRSPVVVRLRREVVYAAIVVAFLFGLAEAGLRIKERLHAIHQAERRGPRPSSFRSVTHDGRPYTDENGAIALATDPCLVFRNVAGQDGEVVTINEDGFRGTSWRRDKPEGTRRVIVLGGSAAFGVGATGDDRVLAPQLERRLDAVARARGLRVEVWNAGVIGYDSTQELVLLATRLIDRAPDVVVLLDGWNDFHQSASGPDRDQALLHPKFLQNDALLVRRTRPGVELLRGLALFRAFEAMAGRARRRSAPRGEYGDYFDHTEGALPIFERNLRAMVRLARAYGVTAVLAPQPEIFQRAAPPPAEVELRRSYERRGYAGYSTAAYPRFVAPAAAVATSESACFVDGTTAFDGRDDVAFVDFVHFNDRGHELLADFLAPSIGRALGW